MKLGSWLERLRAGSAFSRRKTAAASGPPVLGDAVRYPYGPFRFRVPIAKGAAYTVWASRDLRAWTVLAEDTAKEEGLEYLDSEAFKFMHRFYRVKVGDVYSSNVLGYAAVSLPPGFSMIANPFHSSEPVSTVFAGWPEATSLNRFDPVLFRLAENIIKSGQWTNPTERLGHAEGAIFFNPTSDYKHASFTGTVAEGRFSVPVPSGFSVRSALGPRAGNLVEDLKFPIANGDVIHLFDREQQKYVLHPFEDGKWTAGPPIVGVGESFWVAKTEPGNWTYDVEIATPE